MAPFLNFQRYLATYQNQRPFWESDDEIDVGIISDVLVVIYRYIQEDESIPMFQMCLEQTRSCAVKMCAVRALTLLSIEVVSNFFEDVYELTSHPRDIEYLGNVR